MSISKGRKREPMTPDDDFRLLVGGIGTLLALMMLVIYHVRSLKADRIPEAFKRERAFPHHSLTPSALPRGQQGDATMGGRQPWWTMEPRRRPLIYIKRLHWNNKSSRFRNS